MVDLLAGEEVFLPRARLDRFIYSDFSPFDPEHDLALLQHLRENQVITRDSWCFMTGKEIRHPVAAILTLANSEGRVVRSTSDTPTRIYFPGEGLLNANPRFGGTTPQAERARLYRDEARKMDFYLTLVHGFGESGAAMQKVAELAIAIARGKGLRLGVIAPSIMGSEASVRVGQSGNDEYQHIDATMQVIGSMRRAAKVLELDPDGDEWLLQYMHGLVGHSMGAWIAFRTALLFGKRMYPNMVTSVVAPVVMGVNPEEQVPEWVDDETRAKFSQRGVFEHVSLLTDWKSIITKAGIAIGHAPGTEEFRAAVLGSKPIQRIIRDIVTSYIGPEALGKEEMLPVHLSEYINNFLGLQRQVRLLQTMPFITGDATVASVDSPHYLPLMQVAIMHEDNTLQPKHMTQWVEKMHIPLEGQAPRGGQRLVSSRAKLYETGHNPDLPAWRDILEWQIEMMARKKGLL